MIAFRKASCIFVQIQKSTIMQKIKTLIVSFSNELEYKEIELFRGAILNALQNANVLFHNHVGDNFRYSYPLIQYKRIHKKAAIVCINEGTEAIGEFFSSQSFDLLLGERKEHMDVETIRANETVVQIWDSMFQYHLRRWLALNEENYQRYCQLESITDKMFFLERLLTGNILSFAKGIHLYFDKQVICKIVSSEDPYQLYYKNVKMMAFDLEFKTNVSLPDYIGLGKGVSLGHGVICRAHTSNNI